MNTAIPTAPSRFGLVPRLLLIAAVLSAETLTQTLLFSRMLRMVPSGGLTGGGEQLHVVQRWLFRCLIAYAASLAILLYLRSEKGAAVFPTDGPPVPLRLHWLLPHAILLIVFAWVTQLLYGSEPSTFALLAVARPVCALAAAAALFAAFAPGRFWIDILRRSGALPWYALLPALGALLAYQASQLLWQPAAALTFRLVRLLLLPIHPALGSDPATHTVLAGDFAVRITEACSGLEGVGLMLVFCTAWLWYFRREYIFPRALCIVPAALLLIFVLNAVRIAALVIIGYAGYAQIAMVGFHSQAGWIAFNLAALCVAVVAKRSSWLNRSERETTAVDSGDGDITSACLVPLLAILASGMIAHALSAGFDYFYPLRLLGAAAALWVFRRAYRTLDWRCSWRGIATGALIFGVWIAFSRLVAAPREIPQALTSLGEPTRSGWIACRALAAVISVPVAEELAYRGYLMRRIVSREFAALPFKSVGWPAVSISAVAFGVMHGTMWIPACIAGAAYGTLAVKTGKIGESVVAHATTNALITIEVLLFGQWQLW